MMIADNVIYSATQVWLVTTAILSMHVIIRQTSAARKLEYVKMTVGNNCSIIHQCDLFGSLQLI